MANTSLCGLGQAAANPVMSSLKYFRNEYETHIHDSFCAAAVCTDLFEYTILVERCTGCGLCKTVCETNAIQGERRMAHTLDALLCAKCKACVQVCAQRAIVGVPVGTQERARLLGEAA